MMSFVKNFTGYSVGTESFEFSVIPIGFNHNSREISGNPIGFTEIYWGMLKLTEITKTKPGLLVKGALVPRITTAKHSR